MATSLFLPSSVFDSVKYTIRRKLVASTTTVKVSKSTLTELEKLRDRLKVRSLDEAIGALIRRHGMDALRAALGADKRRVRPFTEADRGEGRPLPDMPVS